MLQNMGYAPGRDLFGYPYDWRQSPALDIVQKPFLARLKQAYELSGNKKITVITHSLGGIVFRSFAQLHPDELVKYVKRWIALACPFNGATRMMKAFLLGYNFDLPPFMAPQFLMHSMQISIPLMFWFLPPRTVPYSPKLSVLYNG